MEIENIWGMWFIMFVFIYLPMMLAIYGAYKAGYEEGKKQVRRRR